MTDKLANYAVAVALAMLLDGVTDVAQTSTCYGLFYPELEGFLGNSQEILDLLADLAHTECVARIAAKSVEMGTAVDRNDVALLEGFVVGDAMHHETVDRSTDRSGEWRTERVGKSFEGWLGTMVPDELLRKGV